MKVLKHDLFGGKQMERIFNTSTEETDFPFLLQGDHYKP